MNKEYISTEKFESLSEIEQVQTLNHMLEDVPREDLVMLKDVLPEISKIQKLSSDEKYHKNIQK